jgi:hypothetical protein
MVEGMYTQGILKVECFAFKFLSFDGALNKKLPRDSGVLSPTQGTVIPIPGSVQLKRDADGDLKKRPQAKKRKPR